ncbi:hypothetical protein SISNIDRAFT_449932 [Sistotremastrum niveocremeum HHB9708]|uniref:GRAM domain-containing protein n=2 Tax=Sistotremastraceae TaxID=3402574 RepID=A0A164YRJ3_9AGAM|nr:hypothetical protein SISNIDRAFT_449932 [Sistotremastrum niveocremeum HHB9708]KZT41588.1 hypothetical protein SISSUDRAFT_1042670 [Sistotremastrum suecicum HHB10207 ss-3]
MSTDEPKSDFGALLDQNLAQDAPMNSLIDPEVPELSPDQPTESHALAQADHFEKGASQMQHFETEVKDLGWNEKPEDVPAPLVGGLDNEELWTLVRRFNKQMYHIKALAEPPLGGLDLNIADEEEFSPDKLRANMERMYTTVIIGMVGFGKHIARLRSWREQKRTAYFLAAYSIAWIFDFIVPLIIAFLITLIVYPPARSFCFPPAPIALIDSKTGGIQKPAAGVLGSDNTLTGAPEKHQGEAAEQEASNFVSGLASIALTSATGKHPQGDPHGTDEEASSLEKATPDPATLAMGLHEAKTKSKGGNPSATHDKTKQPMSDAMWAKTRPVMHGIADVADGWERFANALSPTAPFPKNGPRIKLAALLVPVLLVSCVTSSYMFMKANTFIFGFTFFGDPILQKGATWLNRKFPHWQKLLEIRNTILKGVPTNAQLTITLLRIGEANKAPLPPPPSTGLTSSPPPERAHDTAGEDLEHLDASHQEIQAAIHADPTPPPVPPKDDVDAAKPKKKHGSRILGFFRGTARFGVETVLGTDRVKAAAGSTPARNRLGVLPKATEMEASGPVEFPARYKGNKGRLYISTMATSPCICWTKEDKNINPVFSIAIPDIQEIKKVGGFGWKAKLVVGWATAREIVDGIVIVDKEGNERHLTAIQLREELFNRLIAMGPQMWESW